MANNYDPHGPIPNVDFPDYSGTGYGDPQSWVPRVSHSWPSSNMDTTTLEEVEEKARLQAQEKENASWDRFFKENPPEDEAAAADAEPSPMSFFAGRPYEQGLADYNNHRIATGRTPIAKGAK